VYDAIGESRDGEWPPPTPDQVPDDQVEIEASGLFEDVRVRRYVWETSYTADGYLGLLDTFSGHIAMDPDGRAHLYAEIRRRLGRRPDGRVRRHWYAILNVARRRPRALGQTPGMPPSAAGWACGTLVDADNLPRVVDAGRHRLGRARLAHGAG
jgi:hypothetical protein